MFFFILIIFFHQYSFISSPPPTFPLIFSIHVFFKIFFFSHYPKSLPTSLPHLSFSSFDFPNTSMPSFISHQSPYRHFIATTSQVADKNYKRLATDQPVGLRYANLVVFVDQVVKCPFSNEVPVASDACGV